MMETINWNISGMHCDGCSARLQKVLSGKTGIQSASVSFAEKQASLEFDSTLISADQLQEAVEKAGFEIAAA
jgi:copper chaperone CopZ